MGQTPDELKREVERTRADLSSNVDTLADKVNPAHMARRRTESMRRSVVGIKERVMGSATDALQSTRESVGTTSAAVASSVGDATSSLGSSVSEFAQRSPERVRARTEGSPLAAGLIAFGAGMLAAALLPASQAETQAATRLRENADMLEPAKEALTESVRAVVNTLPQREALIVSLRFGLDGGNPRTLQEVAERVGLTRERVRQLEKGALAQLRNPEHSRPLLEWAS